MGRLSSSLGIVRPPALPEPGDYLTDGTNLYCVEELLDDHALVEDCSGGVLIDISLELLQTLAPVRRSSGGERAGRAAGEARPA